MAASVGMKRRPDSDAVSLGFGVPAIRSRPTRADPFEELMASRGRLLTEEDCSMGLDETRCSHCGTWLACGTACTCDRCAEVLCPTCSVKDYAMPQDRTFCLDCHDAERAARRRASPSGPASGPHTPSAARVASGVPPASPAATPAPASTLRGSAEAITLATPHSGAPSPLPSGVWGAGIRRATVSPASAAVVGGSMW